MKNCEIVPKSTTDSGSTSVRSQHVSHRISDTDCNFQPFPRFVVLSRSSVSGPETSAEKPQDPNYGATGAQILNLGWRIHLGLPGNIQGVSPVCHIPLKKNSRLCLCVSVCVFLLICDEPI